MACLRGQTVEGRLRAVQCNEEGCEFRRLEIDGIAKTHGESSEADCILQLRLRAGDAQESIGYGVRTVNWHMVNSEPVDLNSDLFQSLERLGENDRFFLPIDGDATHSAQGWEEVGEKVVEGFVEGLGRSFAFPIQPLGNGLVANVDEGHGVYAFDTGSKWEDIYVMPAKDAGSSWKGPRPNAVYLDEYQRWVGSWEDATDEEVLDDITNAVEKGNLTNWMPVDTGNPHGPSERQLKEFFELNNIKGIQVFTKAGEWRPVGVHDLGEGVQSTDELPGSSRVDSSDQGEVQDGSVVSEESEPMGLIVHGLYVPPAGLHGYKDFGSRVWGKESNHIRGEN